MEGPGFVEARAAGAFMPGFGAQSLRPGVLNRGTSSFQSMPTSMHMSPPASPMVGSPSQAAFTPPNSVIKGLHECHLTTPTQTARPTIDLMTSLSKVDSQATLRYGTQNSSLNLGDTLRDSQTSGGEPVAAPLSTPATPAPATSSPHTLATPKPPPETPSPASVVLVAERAAAAPAAAPGTALGASFWLPPDNQLGDSSIEQDTQWRMASAPNPSHPASAGAAPAHQPDVMTAPLTAAAPAATVAMTAAPMASAPDGNQTVAGVPPAVMTAPVIAAAPAPVATTAAPVASAPDGNQTVAGVPPAVMTAPVIAAAPAPVAMTAAPVASAPDGNQTVAAPTATAVAATQHETPEQLQQLAQDKATTLPPVTDASKREMYDSGNYWKIFV